MHGAFGARPTGKGCTGSTSPAAYATYNLMEEAGLPVTLVNPQRTQVRRGHKTDRGDAAWLADLLRHGLVQASFIPPAAIRALRELTQYRATLVRARAKEVQHLLKTLEAANIKLDAVASDPAHSALEPGIAAPARKS